MRQGKAAHRTGKLRRAGLLAACIGLWTPALALDRLDVQTPGAAKELRDALLASSQLNAAERDKVTAPQDILSAARADYGRLLGTLYAEGYYSGVINITLDGREASGIAALDVPARISAAKVTIVPGPRFNFSTASVTPLAPGTELPARFASGRIARSGVMQEAVVAGIDGWRAVGNAKAAAAGQQITADHRANTVDARFTITPGPRVRFGSFDQGGGSAVRPARIGKIAGFPVGDVFDPAKLALSADRLRRTGTFKSVTLTESDTVNPDGTLDIAVALVDQPKRRLTFGAEIASLDGGTLSATWLHRNLFGGAERLALDASISGIGGSTGGADYSLGARLTRPGTPIPDADAFLTARLEHEDEPDFTADRGSFGLGLSRRLSDRLSAEAGLMFAFERTSDILGTFDYSTLSLPLSVTWDRRDIAINPTTGTYLKADLEPFFGFRATDSGARLRLDSRAYQPLGADGKLVLAGRIQAGAVLGAGLFNVPRDYLFYSGGGGTVRGQPYQSLGVTNTCAGVKGGTAGCVIETGGRSFLGLSGEVRAQLGKNLGLVGFADAGYISGGVFDGTGTWQSGAGIGLRYNTGIGPIRLDVAAPVGGTTGNGVQVYVGIGQAF